MRPRPIATRNLKLLLAACLTLCSVTTQTQADNPDEFSAAALRGVKRVQVQVEGVPDKFARYGLTAEKIKHNTEQRLTAYGIDVVSPDNARDDATASQIMIRLYANEDTYSNYSCLVSVKLRRKVALDDQGQAFVARQVWSQGHNGLLNPSDLPRIYTYVDRIVDQFLSDHGRYNTASQAAVSH